MFVLAADGMVDQVLTNGNPVILVILVTNDNYRQESDGPPFDADESCKVLKTALELFGASVIAVNNESKDLLLAIIESLKTRTFPASCNLLWFIFSGHGRESGFTLNGELVQFTDLICKATEIKLPYSLFFFECCQRHGEVIKVAKVQKEHMAVYSAPPNEDSFHLDGVGLMATALVELLQQDDSMTLNDFQQQIRQKLLDKIVAIKPTEDPEYLRNKYLPIETSTIIKDINMYDKIQEASKFFLRTEFF